MARVLTKLTDRILFGDTPKKIANYFRTATPDSVLHDLDNSYLVQSQPTAYRVQAIFDASCLRDSPQLHPYWTKECLRSHIAKVHPDTAFSDTAIDVLWSCFYFHAYYPFRHENADGGKLEFPAFHRALTLLALRGTSLLGSVNEDGYAGAYWRHYEHPAACVSNINRIFRSIGEVSHMLNIDSQIVAPSTCIIDDVMDVLATTHPYHVKFHPYDRQLREVAERLLEGRIPQYQVENNGLVALLSLILRLKLHEPTWGEEGKHFHYGSFDASSPQNDELAKALVQAFRPGPQGFLAPDCMLRGLDVLPNLEPYFHHLWAAIFQPQKPTDIPAIRAELSSDTALSGILHAVSLIIPPYEAHRGINLRREIEPITFQTSYDSSKQESLDSLSMKHIIQHLTHDDHLQTSHLVLVLGTQPHNMAPVIVGAFFPKATSNTTPEDKKLHDSEELKFPHPEALFQLQPTFTLFRRNRQNTTTDVDKSTTAHVNSLAQPYWIGNPNVGLSIDPVTKEGIFMRPTTGAPDSNDVLFEELAVCHGNNDKGDRATKFTVTKTVIFRLNGGPK